MSAGRASVSLRDHRPFFFITIALIVFTYLADNLVDTLAEGEDFYQQTFAPSRLGLLLFLLLLGLYLLRIVLRQGVLQRLHLAAVESSIDGIAIFDADYKLTYSNRAHTKLYGYQEQRELIGQSWRFLCSEDQVQRFYDEVRPALLQRGEWRGESIGTRKDGSRFPQEISLTRLDNGGIIRVARDNSEKMSCHLELERRAQELAAKNGELETFSYSLSHDMRGYITRISSAAQMLQDGHTVALDENGRFLVTSINRASEDMEQLVESMQLLATLSRARLKPERVNLSQLVASIAAELQLGEPDRKVKFLISPELHAQCDRKLAKVALDNLLGNAWKYTGMVTLAKIEFGAAQVDGKQVFFIRDNGVGFEMEEADKLFEPFLRLQTARAFPGTGIGLATVQRVIQLHEGELWGVGAPGQGATFYFSLGEAPAEAQPAS
jgi:PAS domain S-box-containing protein